MLCEHESAAARAKPATTTAGVETKNWRWEDIVWRIDDHDIFLLFFIQETMSDLVREVINLDPDVRAALDEVKASQLACHLFPDYNEFIDDSMAKTLQHCLFVNTICMVRAALGLQDTQYNSLYVLPHILYGL